MKKEDKINFLVRKAKLSDVNQIYHLGSKIEELEFLSEFTFHEKYELREFLSHPKENILLLAVVKKGIVGFIYAKILARSNGGWCMLDNIAVLKKYRGQGIGSSLLKELYKELKRIKINYVQILEEIHHKKTRAFWKSKGFKEKKVFIWAEEIIK